MKVTVCELSNEPDVLEIEWHALVSHVKTEASNLVLLPEMPFSPWVAWSRKKDAVIWQEAVEAHDRWMPRLAEFAPAVVVGTRPVIRDDRYFNEGFIREPSSGYHSAHIKYYLPDEEGFWEASWYERGKRDFNVIEVNKIRIGFLICTEMWFNDHARDYSRQGIHLLVCPRATPASTVDKWIAGGRTAAVVSGAYCLSANFGHSTTQNVQWGGTGWIIEPEEGNVLARTSPQKPFVTMEIDISAADRAKHTYPRYVLD